MERILVSVILREKANSICRVWLITWLKVVVGATGSVVSDGLSLLLHSSSRKTTTMDSGRVPRIFTGLDQFCKRGFCAISSNRYNVGSIIDGLLLLYETSNAGSRCCLLGRRHLEVVVGVVTSSTMFDSSGLWFDGVLLFFVSSCKKSMTKGASKALVSTMAVVAPSLKWYGAKRWKKTSSVCIGFKSRYLLAATANAATCNPMRTIMRMPVNQNCSGVY